jgi:hypothetical protein
MTDDELLAELRDALREAREVPDSFIAAGKAAFTWRTVDADLAVVASDSSTLAGTRTQSAMIRSMTFVAANLAIEIEVTDDAIAGQLVPPRQARIDVQYRDSTPRTTATDDVGWFNVRLPRRVRAFRISVTLPDDTTVITPWVNL